MERAVALKKLGKLIGKNLGYRVDPNAPTADEREAAKVELKAANAETMRLKVLRDERYTAILAADAEYQELREKWRAAKDRADKLCGKTYHYKFTVGKSSSIFFHVLAEGDSWEEVIRKVEEKR